MEFWDVYNESGQLTGKKVEKGQPLADGQYHLAIEAWIVTPDRRILIQQRSQQCEILPGIWALTTGRAVAGETSLDCCLREMAEELGLQVAPEAVALLRRINRRDETRILWDVYLVQASVSMPDLILQEGEVSGVKLISFQEFSALMDAKEIFTYPEMAEMLQACLGNLDSR